MSVYEVSTHFGFATGWKSFSTTQTSLTTLFPDAAICCVMAVRHLRKRQCASSGSEMIEAPTLQLENTQILRRRKASRQSQAEKERSHPAAESLAKLLRRLEGFCECTETVGLRYIGVYLDWMRQHPIRRVHLLRLGTGGSPGSCLSSTSRPRIVEQGNCLRWGINQ